MNDDIEKLQELNIQIGIAESKGDDDSRDWLGRIIAPHLAFRRANGKINGRNEFLEGVRPSDDRETEIESIEIYGDRAIVTCVVTLKDGKKFHNLRLFIRDEGGWKLLGWANETSQSVDKG